MFLTIFAFVMLTATLAFNFGSKSIVIRPSNQNVKRFLTITSKLLASKHWEEFDDLDFEETRKPAAPTTQTTPVDRRSPKVPYGRVNGNSYRPKAPVESFSTSPEKKFYEPRPTQLSSDDKEYDGDYVYGISPVKLALKSGRRKIVELLVQTGLDASNKKDETSTLEIFRLAKENNIQLRELPKHDLNLLTESRPHQGFVLKASKLEFLPIKLLPPEKEFKCVLVLDEVWDPQNFGALIRTCHFLKVDKVIVCAKNSAPASPSVSKASSGALEVTEIYSVQNLMKFIDESVANGWQVVGTALTGNTLGLSDLPLEKPTIVVLGNEGHGIRTNILNRCTYLIRIGSGQPAEVDSLNVSVTGGIILHHVLQSKIPSVLDN